MSKIESHPAYTKDLAVYKFICLASEYNRGGSDEFEEFVECLGEHLPKQVREALPELARFIDEDEYPEPERVLDVLSLRDRAGYLIQFETPVPGYTHGSKGFFYSWGHTQLFWIYADTLPAAFRAAAKERNAIHAEAKSKAKEKSNV
jgi:hypothetical protein